MSESNNCAGCTKDIEDKQCAIVDGKKYHVACFVCGGCKATLAGKKFHKKENDVFCETCNLERFAPTCAQCQRKISGKHLIVEDKKFHGDCFVCFYCTTPFNKEGYYKEDEKFICKKCLTHRKNRECAGCKILIEDHEVFALGHYYHPECFKCHKCGQTLGDQTFINLEDHSYHSECINSTCVVCGAACDGEFYDVENNNICHVGCIDKYDPAIHTSPPKVICVKEPEPHQEQVQAQVQQHQEVVQLQQAPPQVEERKEQPPPEPEPVQTPVDVVPPPVEKPQNSKYQLKTMETQDVNSLDPTCLDPNRPRFTLAELSKNPPPAGVPLNKKELYLLDEEFEKIFKMKINRFLALKEWKRVLLKKQNNLF